MISARYRLWRKYRTEGARSVIDHGLEQTVFSRPGVPLWISESWCRWRKTEAEQYRAPIDIFKIVWVSPDTITRNSNRERPWERRWPLYGAVYSGDWDRASPPRQNRLPPRFDDRPDYQCLHSHFCEGVPWFETDYIQTQLKTIDAGDSAWKCNTRKKLIERCHLLDRIYTDIQENGYRTQFELQVHNENDSRGFLDLIMDEITVDIGRDGELLFVNGRHRLSMVKCLELDAIPVCFLVRHSEWMETRDRCLNEDSAIAHPDLVEFYNDRNEP